MKKETSNIKLRWLYLAVGTFSLLFAGIIYAWSILRSPFVTEFGWNDTSLALNFTLTMCTFCIGGFLGSRISGKIGANLSLIIAGIMAGGGFFLASLMNGEIILLYLSYAGLAGLGIGIAYNVIISSVNVWFPDKRGFCSGCLLMGFGLTSLIFGSLIEKLYAMPEIGWRKTLMIFGCVMTLMLIVTGLLIRRPASGTVFPKSNKSGSSKKDKVEALECSPTQMIRRPSFIIAFVCTVCLVAVGNSVISFAKQLALSVGATASLATMLVGVLSVCNGLGRIITGAIFDAMGRRFTMIAANMLTVLAAALTLLAVVTRSLPLCIVGLCLVGLSYGSCPTVGSAFVSSFYGQKYFATNYSIINFNLFVASFIATACAGLQSSSGGYIAPFVLLLSLSVFALVMNFCIKKP